MELRRFPSRGDRLPHAARTPRRRISGDDAGEAARAIHVYAGSPRHVSSEDPDDGGHRFRPGLLDSAHEAPVRFGVPMLIVLVGLLLMAWVFNLVRRGRLYVGYGVLVVLAIAGGTTGLVLAPLRHRVDFAFGALFSTVVIAAGVSTMAIVALIYVLTQLTIISNRLAELTQQLAILEARRGEQPPGAGKTP